MAVLKVTLPAGVVPVDGLQVSFKAPCDCNTFDRIDIDGAQYLLCDANGRSLSACHGMWSAGALLTATLDVKEKHAYLQNAAATLHSCNFVIIENLPFDITAAAAGSIVTQSDVGFPENAENSVIVYTVNDDAFKSGDVIEVLRNCYRMIRVKFENSHVYSSTFEAPYNADGCTVVSIPSRFGIAKFIRMPNDAGWLASGDIEAIR